MGKRIRVFGLWIGLSAAAVITVMMLIVVSVGGNPLQWLREFQSFSLTVDNQSEQAMTNVEIGTLVTGDSGQLVTGDSWQPKSGEIGSGHKRVFKPRLSHSGEGGIYMRYTDASGKEVQTTVCSYTEYVSGYTDVTIHNERVEVEENCL